MEMPEGWKRLSSIYNRVSKLQRPDIRSGAELEVRIEDEKRLYEFRLILDLMEEMALALQAYACDSFDATSSADFDVEGQGKMARTVLRKFQDWK